MPLLYDFDLESADDIVRIIAHNAKRRRLEKCISRDTLSQMSGVPSPTIAKFEQKYAISFGSFVAIAKALGYGSDIKKLLSEPEFRTMEELDTINKNKNRKRGRNENSK